MGSSWATAVDIIVSPAEWFRSLRERPKILLPLLVLVLLNAAIAYWYYHGVDFAWLVETQLQGAMPADQPAGALENGPARTILSIAAPVAAAIGIVLVVLVAAAYLAFVSMLTNDGLRFRLWFALIWWCSLPTVFAQLATAVNLLVNDVSHLSPLRLNPISLGNLLGTEGELSRSERFVMNLDPTNIWALVLLVLGYQSWTGRSILKSATIVLGPAVVLAGLVFLLP